MNKVFLKIIAVLFIINFTYSQKLSAEYWNPAEAIATGQFPSFLQSEAGPIVIWEDIKKSGTMGEIYIKCSYFELDSWQTINVSNFSYSYSTVGTAFAPLIYQAIKANNGDIVIAINNANSKIEFWKSTNQGRSYQLYSDIKSNVATVAPRLYQITSGSWILLATRGMSKDSGVDNLSATSLTIVYSTSKDVSSWAPFQNLIEDNAGLINNTSPTHSVYRADDYLAFQSFIPGKGQSPSRYRLLLKISLNGGLTWQKAIELTNFIDPFETSKPEPENFDNQRPQFINAGGSLYLVWERKNLSTGKIYIYSAKISGSTLTEITQVASPSSSWILANSLIINSQPSVIAIENKITDNAVILYKYSNKKWTGEDLKLSNLADPSKKGLTIFASAINYENRVSIIWQYDLASVSKIFVILPVTKIAQIKTQALNFTQNGKTKNDNLRLDLQMPDNNAGLKEFAYIWKKLSPAELSIIKNSNSSRIANAEANSKYLEEIWKNGIKKSVNTNSLDLKATEDGVWGFWASVKDNANNISMPSSFTIERKRTPPLAPIFENLKLDSNGALISSTYDIRWSEPSNDIDGYTWLLRYIGPISDKNISDDLYIKETLAKMPPINLSQKPLGQSTEYKLTNIDDGYYQFSLAAIDTAGNISNTSEILFKSDKYVPFTTIYSVNSSRNSLGGINLSIVGKGFLTNGNISRLVISKSERETSEVDLSLERNEYQVRGDRLIDNVSIFDIPSGNYKIGLYHTSRGWYWTGADLIINNVGTLKFGITAVYDPDWRNNTKKSFPINYIYLTLLLLLAIIGIALTGRKIILLVQEGKQIKMETIALISGDPMPDFKKIKKILALGKISSSLRWKFAAVVSGFILFIVVFLATFLGNSTIRNTSIELASGLDQRARILLESVTQSCRFFLGREDAITQLSFLPSQIKAMPDAVYITITSKSESQQGLQTDVVYSTNDEKINSKIENTSEIAGTVLSLGQSYFKASGSDKLARQVSIIASDTEAQGKELIDNELKLKTRLSSERANIGTNARADARRKEINLELDQIDTVIRDKLKELSDKSVGIIPPFDPNNFSKKINNHLYYKPVLEYRPNDNILYRGMVRLEVNTNFIENKINAQTWAILRVTFFVTAIALILGIIGALLVSTIIISPIRKLVSQIEKIRDTSDMESLAGSTIEVKSKDELYTLANTVNQMTEGLVKAAKASKELVVGKGIQKMFIPLNTSEGSNIKVNTGSRVAKDFEIFGYYEGAKGVSGDYWDFHSINERYHYFIKCDISGKGVSAALIMVQVATIVINYFKDWEKNMPKKIDLTDLAYKINSFIEERGFIGRFAAFTLGVMDSKERLVYLVVAGDLKLHIWSSKESRLIENYMAPSQEMCPPAAGIFPSDLVELKQPYKQVTKKLEKDDVLILYTDGIEESKRYFRDSELNIIKCTDVEADKPHGNHLGGVDNEEFGYDRIVNVLNALDKKTIYTIEKWHDTSNDNKAVFDFSRATGSLSEKVLSLIAVEKIYRMYLDSKATEKDLVFVDMDVDEFLSKYFSLYRLYCGNKKELAKEAMDNPGYICYTNVKEDEQYDDLTILAIRAK